MIHAEKHKQLLDMFLTKEVSLSMIEDHYDWEKDSEDLHYHVVENLKPEFNWSTGIGIIEAVALIVEESKNNANI